MLGCAGAGLDGDGAERGRATFGKDDAVDSGSVGYTQKSAQVLRVFNAVEGEEQARGIGLLRREEVFDGEKLLRADQGHNALVSGSLGELGQLLARFLANADAESAAESDEAGDAGIFTLAGHENVIKAAASGLKGFFDRMQPVENFHSFSVEDRWCVTVILISMQADAMAEWQRLTQLYREMGDGELEALDAGKGDLTEVAQQVLRDEMRKRGLDKLEIRDKPSGPNTEADASKRFASPIWNSHGDSATGGEATEEGDELVEYTWKTPLCDCKGREEAWELQEVLRQAGIESWIEGPGYQIGHELSCPRIVVAADQLEKAHEIISQPISQEIVEQSKAPIEEYVPPVCPSCGTEDPILESADPVNSWRCESCGRQWSEQVEDAKDSMAQPQSTLNPRQVENPFDTGPMLAG